MEMDELLLDLGCERSSPRLRREQPRGQAEWIEDKIQNTGVLISPAQAAKIKEYSQNKELTKAVIDLILDEEKPKARKVTFKGDKLSKYFPDEMSAEEIEEEIIRILDEWKDKGGQ